MPAGIPPGFCCYFRLASLMLAGEVTAISARLASRWTVPITHTSRPSSSSGVGLNLPRWSPGMRAEKVWRGNMPPMYRKVGSPSVFWAQRVFSTLPQTITSLPMKRTACSAGTASWAKAAGAAARAAIRDKVLVKRFMGAYSNGGNGKAGRAPGVARRRPFAGFSGSGVQGLAQVGAVQQGLDVEQDQHAVVERADAADEAGIDRGAELRGGADLLGGQRHHVGHAVDHAAHHAVLDVQHDHHGEAVVARFLQAQLQAQVDHRHDGAAQVDHALDVLRRVRDAGDRVVAPDLLDLEDVDAVVLLAQGEGEEFAGRGDRGAAHCLLLQGMSARCALASRVESAVGGATLGPATPRPARAPCAGARPGR